MYENRIIEIVDEKGEQIEVTYKLQSNNNSDEEGFKNYAERILNALGDEWAINESKINEGVIKISNTNPLIEWLTILEVEALYDLAAGSVRRDIRREKFASRDIKKVGRDWRIKSIAAKDLYANRVKRKSRKRINIDV